MLLIQWQVPQNGISTGMITEDQASGTPPRQNLAVTTIPVSVTINGSQVTLTPFNFLALMRQSLSGSLDGGGLTVTVPPNPAISTFRSATLEPSDPSAYNADVAALRRAIDNADLRAEGGLRPSGSGARGEAYGVQ